MLEPQPMSSISQPFTSVVIGEESLLIQCCDLLIQQGNAVIAVASQNHRILRWCEERKIRCFGTIEALSTALEGLTFDFLFSITNLRMLPSSLIARPSRMAINFHDGPLPRYAGLNAPVWALMNGEQSHGVTWHQMNVGADTGDILTAREFLINEDDTAFALNAQCYEAGLVSFSDLLDLLQTENCEPLPQDLSQRTYYGLTKRPFAGGIIDWRLSAKGILRLIRALDFGTYPNPLVLPKLYLRETFLLVREANLADGSTAAQVGEIQALSEGAITVRCADGAITLRKLSLSSGTQVTSELEFSALGLRPGRLLPQLSKEDGETVTHYIETVCRYEAVWKRRRQSTEYAPIPFAQSSSSLGTVWQLWRSPSTNPGQSLTYIALILSRLTSKLEFTLAYFPRSRRDLPPLLDRFVDDTSPLPITIKRSDSVSSFSEYLLREINESERAIGMLSDLGVRSNDTKGNELLSNALIRIVRLPSVGEEEALKLRGPAALTVVIGDSDHSVGFLADTSRFSAAQLSRLLNNLSVISSYAEQNPTEQISLLPILTEPEILQLGQFSGMLDVGMTSTKLPTRIHELFEAQVLSSSSRTACHFNDSSITYEELNAQANQLARHLQANGVGQNDRVGVLLDRSHQMLVALYAILKSGAAYVPLDPLYPSERLAYVLADAAVSLIISEKDTLSVARSLVLEKQVSIEASPRIVVLEEIASELQLYPAVNINIPGDPSDLAYLIYTSGSTGKPKGVMVEHANVTQFFAGMDERLGTEQGIWLAVTSISFDISVLELFWTLTRGFTVVLYNRTKNIPQKNIDFGLFYWNVARDEDSHANDKYRLLLEGAKYADENGFNAVWNPERHFRSFGGLFPNPSVTCAALATITKKVSLRAGSCVVPLHSPIRVVEEWSVVDNLSNGRVGIAAAAGWAPLDFAIRPGAFANAKQEMFDSLETIRKLWRGETVVFAGPSGNVSVRTLPRPVQKELPVWVTTAGNIETYKEAGAIGANLLTHLLGQTVDEVASKVEVYRKAWSDAGHPGRGVVTLMLHTFVGPDETTVKRLVHKPLKEYLRSAVSLVKDAAWQFPTFKKMSEEQGKSLDQFFETISADDMDGLLEFAFERYFYTSGLFGTTAHCLRIIDQVNLADVDELACLIDFGIDTDTVLAHLPFLNELRKAAQRQSPTTTSEVALPRFFDRHRISHLQCTPSMAAMLVSDSAAHAGLSSLKHIMIGGEAFPPTLARALRSLTNARVTNMYGPTETTVWSSTGDIDGHPPEAESAYIPIGRPLPNQTMYILDEQQQALPPGLVGELVIGGSGVTRGYWHNESQTRERFLPDPFCTEARSRMYRTGDLARFLPDGRIECLGRNDQQVKIRGFRVELGEIETVLKRCTGVGDAAVLLREDTPGDQRLVAYLRPTEFHGFSVDSLTSKLQSKLPEYMVPKAFVILQAFPLTPNGKLNRKALPLPTVEANRLSEYQVPSNGIEAMICSIWQNVLGVAEVGMRENFFDIGGHSLLVVQVLAQLRSKVNMPLQVTDLFRYSTIEALARFISAGVVGTGAEKTISGERGKIRADARRAAMERRAVNSR